MSERPLFNPPTTADKVWLMENGHLPRDEELIKRFHHQKELARRAFIEEMKEVHGFKKPR